MKTTGWSHKRGLASRLGPNAVQLYVLLKLRGVRKIFQLHLMSALISVQVHKKLQGQKKKNQLQKLVKK